ncbi:MAG: hypothetical protein ACLU0O_09520 [Collinsella sp.]
MFAMTVPASQGSEFYLITGTKGSGATKAIKLKASVADGKAYVRLTKENTGTDNVTNYLFNSALDLTEGRCSLPVTILPGATLPWSTTLPNRLSSRRR